MPSKSSSRDSSPARSDKTLQIVELKAALAKIKDRCSHLEKMVDLNAGAVKIHMAIVERYEEILEFAISTGSDDLAKYCSVCSTYWPVDETQECEGCNTAVCVECAADDKCPECGGEMET